MNFLLQKCLCFSLRTGAVVVGIFSLLSATAGFVMAVDTLYSSGKSYDKNMDDITEDTGTLSYSILLILSLTMILFAILVLIAARKNDKHNFLLPWLILFPLSAFTGIGFTIYFAILHWIEQELASMGKVYAAASVGTAALGILCWLVIFSYYFELREVNKKNIAKNLPEV